MGWEMAGRKARGDRIERGWNDASYEDGGDERSVLLSGGDDGLEVCATGCRWGTDSYRLRPRMSRGSCHPVSQLASRARSEESAVRGGREIHRAGSGNASWRRILGHCDRCRELQALLLRYGRRADRLYRNHA